jgi:DNA polymerase III sliding clamp (beta) subunit (PCNA family)
MRFDPKIKPEVFAGKDTTREYLTRVQLDTEAKALVATDGHRLIVTPISDAEADHTGPIDATVLVAARKAARKYDATIGANGHCVLADGTTYLRPGDAKDFPRWQQVVPKDASEVKARVRVNASYLADVFKATGAESVELEIRGELDPVVCRTQGELGETLIVIMPMRR